MNAKKPSTILLRAAELVDEPRTVSGCFAIYLAANYCGGGAPWLGEKEALRYFSLFKPRRGLGPDRRPRPATGFWWYPSPRNPERLTALCLAAAIAKSEGR